MDKQALQVYNGPRDQEFKDMIKTILKLGKLKEKYIDVLLDEEGLSVYDKVFTHPSVDPLNNYEFYEILGDITVNKCVVWYSARRFPELNNPQGVPIIARIRINLGAKENLFQLAEKNNMWKFITADEVVRNTKKKKTLEDVFEAFIGATELIIDNKIRRGAGYEICYCIIENIFDQIKISLKYEDLFDAKTRLKEVFDFFPKDSIGTVVYESTRQEPFSVVTIYRVIRSQKQRLGVGKAALKVDAEQVAAKAAIEEMKKMGFTKPPPEIFSKFIL
jgi:dsRNA-specific ribonuclease